MTNNNFVICNGCGCGHHGEEPMSEIQKQFQNLRDEHKRTKELGYQRYDEALQSIEAYRAENEELRTENEALREALRKNDAVGQ